MGKNHHPKQGKPDQRDPQNPKPVPSTSSKTPNTQTTSKSDKAGNNNVPKATPQAQTGKVPAKAAIYPLTQKPQFLKPEIPPNQPKNHTGRPFVIPKGGDKRPRDPSQSSGSGRSIVPPPTKRSYAEATKPYHNQQVIDMQWPALQLRVYNSEKHNEHISNNAFHVLKNALARHTLDFIRTNPTKSELTFTSGIYYNKVLKCGIINCESHGALEWYKEALSLIGGQTFRAWTKDEQLTVCVKIFVPLGLDSITNLEYLEATRIIRDTDSTKGIPWTLLKEYIHHTKHTRIIIATIPAEVFEDIQKLGSETRTGSKVWKVNGFLGPLKLTLASENDLKSPTPTPKHTEKSAIDEADDSTIQNSPSSSPPPPIQDEETTPEKPTILYNNPLLSEAAGSMSPLHTAMDAITVSNEEEEDAERSEETQEEMDFGLLTSPAQSDTEDFSGSWADQ